MAIRGDRRGARGVADGAFVLAEGDPGTEKSVALRLLRSEGLSPLDAELNLPPEKATLAVQRRIAEEASRARTTRWSKFSRRPPRQVSQSGKGVVVRKKDLRPATQKAAEKKPRPKLDKRSSKGEKRNRKRMATVAAVYTVASFVRTPEEVVAMLAASSGRVRTSRSSSRT